MRFCTTCVIKRRGKVGYAAIKLDMSKAYDRVEWIILRDLMIRMGFSISWVELIMKSVRTESTKRKWMGVSLMKLLQTEGWEKGGPLSPYLFLVVCWGLLSSPTYGWTWGRNWRGKNLSQDSKHLLLVVCLVDDSLILVRANWEDATKLQGILDLYTKDMDRLSIKRNWLSCLAKHTRSGCKAVVMQQIGIKRESFNERYLGLPIHVDSNNA